MVLPSDEALDTFPRFGYSTGKGQKHQSPAIPGKARDKEVMVVLTNRSEGKKKGDDWRIILDKCPGQG